MEHTMGEDKLKAMATEFAKHLKTEQDLNQFSRMLKKMTVEAALEGELDDHLGYDKHAPEGRGSGNSRNGKTTKPQNDSRAISVMSISTSPEIAMPASNPS